VARQIVVEVVGDASKFSQATKQATESAGGFGSAINGMVMGAGIAAFNAVSNAISTVISKVEESGAIFREDQVSLEKMTQAIKNSVPAWDGATGGIEKYVAGQARLGFAAMDVRDSLGLLIGVTHDVAQAQKDEALAQDLARAKGMSLSEATGILTKVHEGNFKALKGIGIELTAHIEKQALSTKQQHELTLAQLAYTDAVKKHGLHSEMAHKAAMHLQDVQASLNKLVKEAITPAEALAAVYANVKDQAAGYADTSAGKLEAAQAMNTASWVKIGAIVDQVASLILPRVATAFSNIADWITTSGVPIFNNIWNVVKQIGSAFLTILQPAIDVVKAHMSDLQTIGGALGVALKVAFAIIVIALAGVVTSIVNMVVVFASMYDKAKVIVGNFVATFQGMKTLITSASSGMFDGIMNAFKAALNWIIGKWNSLTFTLPKISAFGQTIGGTAFHVPSIPYFHSGGTVPGPAGSDVLAMLQAGETVTSAGAKSGGDVYVNIGTFIGSGSDIDRLADMIALRMRLSRAL
jgi:hypothetical protein